MLTTAECVIAGWGMFALAVLVLVFLVRRGSPEE